MAEKGIVILDTNILIEIIRKNGEVIQKCDSAGTENLAISSISRSEFLLGSRDKEDFEKNRKFVDKFLLLRSNQLTKFSLSCMRNFR
jgi:predicted nucleic acid-binding protein